MGKETWGWRRANQKGAGWTEGEPEGTARGSGTGMGALRHRVCPEVSRKGTEPCLAGDGGGVWGGRWLAPGVQLSLQWGGGQYHWEVSPEFQEVGVGSKGGGVCAIPSPKRCSPRRLGLANSYSVVAGWACGTERPDMAAEASAALVRGAATPPAAWRAGALSGVGAGSTPPKIVQSLGRGRGGEPGP